MRAHARARRGDEGDLDRSDEASYHGELRRTSTASGPGPKPVQRPHPPVLVGGTGPTVLDRVLAFGDAWFPNYADDDLRPRIARAARRAPTARSTCMVIGAPADPARARAARARPGVRASSAGCRRRPRGPVERALERWEARDRRAPRRGVRSTEAEARAAVRGGAGRAPGHRGRRTAARTSSRSCSPCSRATRLSRASTANPSARPRCAGSPTSRPTRAWRCSSTTTTTTGPRCGGCAPTARAACLDPAHPEGRAAVQLLAARYPRFQLRGSPDRHRRHRMVVVGRLG